MGISKVVADTFRDTSAGAIEGAVGLVDLASQGGAYLYNKATGRNIEPLQYGPMVSDALDLNPDRDSAAYIGGSLVGGAFTGGAGAIRSGLQAGAKEGAKAAGTSLAAEAAGYAGSVGAARAAEAAGYGETGQMVAGLAGGIAAGARVPGAGAPVKQDIFGGTGSYEPDTDALRQALRLEKEGKRAEDIWQRTGWFRGKDGNWRFEIDDSLANLKSNIDNDTLTTVGEALDHPQLFNQYPELKRMPLKAVPLEMGADGTLGYYHPRDKYLAVYPGMTNASQRSTILHELQHAVQDIEGHSPGGSPGIAHGYLEDSFDTQRRQAGIPKDYEQRKQADGEYYDQLRSLGMAERFLRLNNITQPRQLFNSSLWYEHSDEVRRRIGPPPRRGQAQLAYAQRAGKEVAKLEAERLENSRYITDRASWFRVQEYLEKGTGRDQLDAVKKQIKSLEGKRKRNRERGKLDTGIRLDGRQEFLGILDPLSLYRRLEGEAEAFNVQHRESFDPAARRVFFPMDTMTIQEGEKTKNIARDVIPGAPGLLRAEETNGGVGKLYNFDPDEK